MSLLFALGSRLGKQDSLGFPPALHSQGQWSGLFTGACGAPKETRVCSGVRLSPNSSLQQIRTCSPTKQRLWAPRFPALRKHGDLRTDSGVAELAKRKAVQVPSSATQGTLAGRSSAHAKLRGLALAPAALLSPAPCVVSAPPPTVPPQEVGRAVCWLGLEAIHFASPHSQRAATGPYCHPDMRRGLEAQAQRGAAQGGQGTARLANSALGVTN